MEFVIGVYAIIYVLWLILCVVAGVAKVALNITLFFAVLPFVVAFIIIAVIVFLAVSPLICIFSEEAREAFRQSIVNKG